MKNTYDAYSGKKKKKRYKIMFRSRITIFPFTFRSLIKLKDYIHGAR